MRPLALFKFLNFIEYTRDSVLMDSVVFYQPQLATVPNFKDRLVRPSSTLPRNNAGSVLLHNGERSDDSSDDDDFPQLSELLPKQRLDLLHNSERSDDSSDDDDFPPLSKLLPKQRGDWSMTENTGEPTSSFRPRAGGSQDEPIVLNDDDDESESTQSEGTHSEAGDGHHDVGTTDELDAAPPPDPTCGLMDDRLDPAPQLLLSNPTAAPPRDPTSELIGDGFDIASQLLLSDCTDSVANGSNAGGNNNNNSVINDECLLPTKRQRPTSSCGNPTLDCDGLDKLEDDYVFDVIATDDDEDARPPKRRRLPAVSCRYPSPANTISKIQGDKIDQAQSPIAAAAAMQQLDLRSGHDYHCEGIAESASDNSRSLINGEPADAASSVTVALQSTDARDPQLGDVWEIRSIIGTRKVNGVVHYWVDWEPT